MKAFWNARRHLWAQSYWVLFLVWFVLLERFTVPVTWMDGPLDKLVPFCEWFVFPYLSWFFYMAAALVYFYLTSLEDYYRLCLFMFTGMTICLLIYTFFPNGQNLRPAALPRENLACFLVQRLYAGDTPTNVSPSIHCLNAIAVHLSVRESPALSRRPLLRGGSFVVMLLICMSTVFIKQHAVMDVFWAAALALPLYLLCYRVRFPRLQRA